MYLNVLYAKNIRCLCFKIVKKVIFSVIPNGKEHGQLVTLASGPKSQGRQAKSKGQRRWYYLAIKKLSSLLREITSKHQGDFYCLIFIAFILLQQKENLKRIKRYVKIKIFVTL